MSGIPLAIRADRVERPDGGGALGHIVLLTNLTDWKAAGQARERLRRAIVDAQGPGGAFSPGGGTGLPGLRQPQSGRSSPTPPLAVAEVVEAGGLPPR